MTANRRKGGRLLLQQLGGPARDGQLGLQLEDPTPGRHQFVVLLAAQAGRQALVDAVLTTPGGDRLGTDPQRLSDLSDRPSGLDQVQDLAAELREPQLPMLCSSHRAACGIQQPNSTELGGTTNSLH